MSSLSQPRNAAFVTSRPSFVSSEIRPLLQSRLRLACALACVTLTIMFCGEWALNDLFTPRVLLIVCVELVNIVGFGIAAVLMWRIPEIRLERLRQLETVIVVAFAVSTALAEYMWLISGARVAAVSGMPAATHTQWMSIPTRGMLFGDRDGMLMISIGWSFPWTALLCAYNGWIPTTLRRSLTLTGLAFALAFAGTGAAALTVPELASTYLLVGGTMLMFMTPLTVLGLTAARKMEALRQQAFEARRLGQYTLERKLGEGGMGEVYLARHQFLRRPCAVKLIRTDAADAHSSLVRFEREVQAMAALTHPNTVEIFDYGRSDEGTFYYVMEYLPGLSLDELVRRYGPLPPARVVYLMRQVCDALCEAHAVGLLHRDIKPRSVSPRRRALRTSSLFICSVLDCRRKKPRNEVWQSRGGGLARSAIARRIQTREQEAQKCPRLFHRHDHRSRHRWRSCGRRRWRGDCQPALATGAGGAPIRSIAILSSKSLINFSNIIFNYQT